MFPLAPTNLAQWIKDNHASFTPPICNKMLYRGPMLSIMLVGGPNQRRDFHSEEGSEFFFQLEGRAEIITRQDGRLVPVVLNSGDLYLLPSRIPHSPQRFAHSMGLVIERNRMAGELDTLSWYNAEEELEFERYFVCRDLGRDLLPVVDEYRKYGGGNGVVQKSNAAEIGLDQQHLPLCRQVPAPLQLSALTPSPDSLFGASHPDGEFYISLHAHAEHTIPPARGLEVFLLQLKGSAWLNTTTTTTTVELREGECCVFDASSNALHISRREKDSLGLVVMVKDVRGNKRTASARL